VLSLLLRYTDSDYPFVVITLISGQYRCGPAPVSAIKKGEIGRVQYDAPFIFAEVNADVVEWGILPNQNDWISQQPENCENRNDPDLVQ
jgi:hypothetical protein